MKANKFTDEYVTCPKCNKTYQMTLGQKTCPLCGELIKSKGHVVVKDKK